MTVVPIPVTFEHLLPSFPPFYRRTIFLVPAIFVIAAVIGIVVGKVLMTPSQDKLPTADGWEETERLRNNGNVIDLSFIHFDPPSDPTSATTSRGALDFVEMSRPLSFLFSEPTDPGNAGDDYAKALGVYRTHRDIWRSVEERLGRSGIEAVIGEREIALLRQLADHCHAGARKAKMEYSVPHGQPPTVSTDQTDSLAMTKVMGYMHVYAQYLFLKAKNQGEARAAETVAKDLLVMGWHLARERSYPTCTSLGFGFQEQASRLLADIHAKYPELAAGDMGTRMREYAQSARMAYADSMRLWLTWTMNPKPGDFFNVIENCKDPAWRVQAILGLGITRHRNDGHEGDRVHTEKILAKYAAEGTELEKRAVKAALELSRAEGLRSGLPSPPAP